MTLILKLNVVASISSRQLRCANSNAQTLNSDFTRANRCARPIGNVADMPHWRWWYHQDTSCSSSRRNDIPASPETTILHIHTLPVSHSEPTAIVASIGLDVIQAKKSLRRFGRSLTTRSRRTPPESILHPIHLLRPTSGPE